MKGEHVYVNGHWVHLLDMLEGGLLDPKSLTAEQKKLVEAEQEKRRLMHKHKGKDWEEIKQIAGID